MYTEVRLLEQAFNVAEVYLRKGLKVEIKPVAKGFSVKAG